MQDEISSTILVADLAGLSDLVIGRPITQAQNPVQVLSDVNKSIA